MFISLVILMHTFNILLLNINVNNITILYRKQCFNLSAIFRKQKSLNVSSINVFVPVEPENMVEARKKTLLKL